MSGAATFELLTRLLNYVFAIPFLILGIMGSLLTVIVFTRKRSFWRNTTITYLLAGAIVTGIHLPTIYIQMILVYGFNTSLMNTNVAACREHTYLRYVTTVAAISFPCWASFDQYASTSRRVAFRNRWSSLRVARIIVVCNILFWIVIYIPVIFSTAIRHGVCTFVPGSYTTFNTYVFTPLVYCIGPITVVTYCTRGTIKNLRSTIIRNTHERLTKQVRAMLFPQLMILAISGIPFGFQGVYLDITSYVEKDHFRIAVENFAGQVILIFYHFNYVFTFYIYVFMSSEVRKIIQHEIFRFIGITRVSPTNFTTDNSISLRPLNNMNSAQKS
ncbi:unnamed protein product [Rotaria sp. Silwood2]|nr:unnamed protein product [Rotaria sp. Silwood2]CAF2512300.1 unnamed protein product [Rotaria sp. Silwood2]CAF2746518.1 unnamed protein product [Rotaria sp. Silwood2]CAF2889869.1 unnamed protein product [Rotaria sp. Silwood2]CAF4148623.1 unnamed protein product [Rotaria sp. Silwood2]